MKKLLAFVLALSGCSACAGKVAVQDEPMPTPIALMNRYGAAHACPVAGYLVTAHHVAYRSIETQSGVLEFPQSYLAEDGRGRLGGTKPVAGNEILDLALMTLPYDIEFYKKGDLPARGSRVWWIEYNFREKIRAYNWLVREAKVINTRADHIVLSQPATPGASGTCVFNDANEVVGIISYGRILEDGGKITVAVGLKFLPGGE